mgnify:FL=1
MEEDNVVQDPPNTRFPRRPETMTNSSLFKQPARNYYKLLKLLTMVGEGLASTGDFLGSAARGPAKFIEKIKSETQELIDRDNQFFEETQTNNVPLKDIIARLQDFRDNNDN